MMSDQPIQAALQRQTDIYLNGLAGDKPHVPINMEKLARAAQAKLTPEAFAYIAGGAGLETTIDANRAAFDRWKIVPRMLHDITHRDTRVELLGMQLPAPFLLSPIGVLEMAHPQADRAAAQAAAKEGIPFIFSSQSGICTYGTYCCCDEGRAALVPTLLEQEPGVGRQFCKTGRSLRLWCDCRHAGYHHARLADS